MGGGAGVCARAGALAGGAGANGALPPPAGNGVGYGRSVRLEAFSFSRTKSLHEEQCNDIYSSDNFSVKKLLP